jgi:hypothetical protein
MPLEANDRCLAQHRFDDSPGADRVVADRRPGTGARVRDEDHPLADAEGWGWLLSSARRSPRGRRWAGGDCNNHRRGHRSGDLVLVIVLVILVVIVDDGDDPDLDIDLLGVVQLHGITFGALGGGRIGFVGLGVSGGV